jgi:hypothetical protein
LFSFIALSSMPHSLYLLIIHSLVLHISMYDKSRSDHASPRFLSWSTRLT